MKKIVFLLITAVFLFSGTQAYAKANDRNDKQDKLRQEMKNEIREEVKEKIKDVQGAAEKKEIKKELKQNIFDLIKDKIKNFKFTARVTGIIEAITDSILTVTGNDGQEYQVNIGDKTQLRRRFWGKSSTSEYSVGDKVNVIGRWVDEAHSQINAHLVRNTSVQKRWGAFIGEVTAVSGENLTIKTVNRGELTVGTNDKTKIVSRDEKTIALSDIKVGHRIRIKGVWDNETNEVSDVSHIKDFSLPVKQETTPSVTPTATPSPSLSLTPTPTTTQ
jgi:hypothetical protein